MEFALEIDDVRAFESYGALDEWYPPEGAPVAAAGTESRRVVRGVARGYESFAYLVDRIGVQPEFGGAASRQFAKIEMGRPALLGATASIVGFDPPLDFAAIVPDEVDRTRMSVEILTDRRVLDPIPEGQNHVTEYRRNGCTSRPRRWDSSPP